MRAAMKFNSWGNYPVLSKDVYPFASTSALKNILTKPHELICYGNGRSYGDSALNKQIIDVKPHHYFLNFDPQEGLLHCQSGILLSEILEAFVPRGFFLSVTPGTKYITLGGAIASDVHGKNHHVAGSFSDSVVEFRLMLNTGEIITCSREQNTDFFKATCGGMGLTGVILDAKIKLRPVYSTGIEQTTIKTRNLKETFEAFEQHQDFTYSVAWIDCLAKGENLGRSLLMLGEHMPGENISGEERDHTNLIYRESNKVTLPFYFPSFLLNKFSVKAFNALYYGKSKNGLSKQCVTLNNFFYPLDSITQWNKMYGKKGFIQYQFVLPLKNSYDGLVTILTKIANSGKGSFLAVLKLFGRGNSNWLSFPKEGYTLALDFKIEPGLFELLDELDQCILEYGGRFYLAKDARVSKTVFEAGYPAIAQFREFRSKHKMNQKFNSLQSSRLGI